MARVRLWNHHKKNLELIKDWLRARHEVQVAEYPDSSDLSFDLGIIDQVTLSQGSHWIEDCRKKAEPLFLPFLFISSRPYLKLARGGLWKQFDDMLVAPVEKLEFEARIEILLRTRRLSQLLQLANQELKTSNLYLEERVQQRTQELTEALRAQEIAQENLKKELAFRDRFLTIASHELNTPMTSILLQLQSAARKVTQSDPKFLSSEGVGKVLAQLERPARKMTKLVSNMLEVSRIQAGNLIINKKDEVELCHLVETTVEVFRPIIEDEGGTLEIEHCGEVYGTWDSSLIEETITHLLINASTYAKGKPIHVRVERAGAFARLIIRDAGRGMSKGDLERIFDRFERAVCENEVCGLGLGLYLCQQIVAAHGGRIWAESEPSKGSTFFVELPLKEEKTRNIA
jgi:signal transduction histidine kinase